MELQVTAGSAVVAQSKCTTVEGKVTAGSRSLCAPHAGVIDAMVSKGLTAQRIWQDLRAAHGFGGSYEAVKRFVNGVKARTPERVWRVESQPAEELQVDYMRWVGKSGHWEAKIGYDRGSGKGVLRRGGGGKGEVWIWGQDGDFWKLERKAEQTTERSGVGCGA